MTAKFYNIYNKHIKFLYNEKLDHLHQVSHFHLDILMKIFKIHIEHKKICLQITLLAINHIKTPPPYEMLKMYLF